jgi:hypothetical protein
MAVVMAAEGNLREKLTNSFSSTTHRTPHTNHKLRLFSRYQRLIEERDKLKFVTGRPVAGFFVPRLNIFLGKPMKYGGVYPDAVIRLIKNGKARFPAKSVHELIEVDGDVGWLTNDLLHHDSPTLSRYLARNRRYVDLLAKDLKNDNLKINMLNFYLYTIHYPLITFFSLFFRHKSILDGYRGFIWSFFSSLRFSRAYIRYWKQTKTAV